MNDLDLYPDCQQEVDQAKRETEAWKDTANLALKNEQFYYELLRKCAGFLGDDVRRQDDGNLIPENDFLALRVPELVEKLTARVRELEARDG